jgi:hypothetical protein
MSTPSRLVLVCFSTFKQPTVKNCPQLAYESPEPVKERSAKNVLWLIGRIPSLSIKSLLLPSECQGSSWILASDRLHPSMKMITHTVSLPEKAFKLQTIYNIQAHYDLIIRMLNPSIRIQDLT